MKYLILITDNEHVQELQNEVDEQLKKVSTRDVQDAALLDLDQDHPASSTADEHSTETEVSCLGLYCAHRVLFELILP